MRVAHLGMTIRNTQKTLDFYCNVLGAKLLWHEESPQQGEQTDIIFGIDNAQVTVSGVDLHGTVIEFFEFHQLLMPEGSFRTTYETGGWKHLALAVNDIDSKVVELKEKGVHFRYPVQTLPHGPRMVYFDDPDGIMLELIQFEPQGTDS